MNTAVVKQFWAKFFSSSASQSKAGAKFRVPGVAEVFAKERNVYPKQDQGNLNRSYSGRPRHCQANILTAGFKLVKHRV